MNRVAGVGTSLVLLAVGAVLAFAVSVDTDGFNLNTIGLILMVVGGIGLLVSLVFWNSWGGFRSRRTYVEDAPVQRTVVRDEVV